MGSSMTLTIEMIEDAYQTVYSRFGLTPVQGQYYDLHSQECCPMTALAIAHHDDPDFMVNVLEESIDPDEHQMDVWCVIKDVLPEINREEFDGFILGWDNEKGNEFYGYDSDYYNLGQETVKRILVDWNRYPG
jgi:hypothetical protein